VAAGFGAAVGVAAAGAVGLAAGVGVAAGAGGVVGFGGVVGVGWAAGAAQAETTSRPARSGASNRPDFVVSLMRDTPPESHPSIRPPRAKLVWASGDRIGR
jgi:hypothetical protein